MKIIDFIACEDIRTEIHEKHTLVGVLPTDVNITFPKDGNVKWPVMFKISLFVRLKIEREDIRPDYFEIDFVYNNSSISKLKGDFKMPDTIEYVNIAVSNVFTIPMDGILAFKLSLYSNKQNVLDYIPEYKMKYNIAKQ